MPPRTQLFAQLPWIGGLNTSVDESQIPPHQLTVADNLIFDTQGSRKKREGINHNWDSGINSTQSLVGLHDYWFGATARTQQLVSVASDGAAYSYAGGTRTALTVGGTAWSGPLASASMITFNNLCLIAVSGAGNVIKKYDGTSDLADLDGTPPEASILATHQGRIFCNDKTRPDRLHYSAVSDHTTWMGVGDSGAIDIGVGDGDPEGITAIFPTFKGDLFVAKRTKLYRISGYSPETWVISLVSSGIGCVSHSSVAAVDQDDIMFVSEKGVHSLGATAAYGDFTSNYVSVDIQRTFNALNKANLKYSWGAYLDNINSVAFAFTSGGSAANDVVYLYNLTVKGWYRWPALSATAMIVANDADRKRLYFGTTSGRVSKSFTGANYDVTNAGTQQAVDFRVVTGQLFVDSNPYTRKAFKRFILYYKPQGTHTISASVKIDNIPLNAENSMSYSETSSSALLGSSFVLGGSALGYEVVMGPYARSIDGVGRGCKVEVSQSGINEQVEIQGFGIEFESAGTSAEIVLR